MRHFIQITENNQVRGVMVYDHEELVEVYDCDEVHVLSQGKNIERRHSDGSISIHVDLQAFHKAHS